MKFGKILFYSLKILSDGHRRHIVVNILLFEKYYDVTPLCYFLWAPVKSLFYVYKSTTIDDLEANMSVTISEKVSLNWASN